MGLIHNHLAHYHFPTYIGEFTSQKVRHLKTLTKSLYLISCTHFIFRPTNDLIMECKWSSKLFLHYWPLPLNEAFMCRRCLRRGEAFKVLFHTWRYIFRGQQVSFNFMNFPWFVSFMKDVIQSQNYRQLT